MYYTDFTQYKDIEIMTYYLVTFFNILMKTCISLLGEIFHNSNLAKFDNIYSMSQSFFNTVYNSKFFRIPIM